MEHLDFVLWMVGYPIASSISNWLGYLSGRKYSDAVHGIAALISISVWVYVGYLLY